MAVTPIYGLTKPTVGGDSGLWGGYLNTDVDTLEEIIARPKLPYSSPTVGATTTCDLSLARIFKFTVSQATTLAFSNVPSSSFGVFIDLIITNGSAFALSFPGSVSWIAGGIPGFQASGVDAVRMVTVDGGTTWYAWPTSNPRQGCSVYKSGTQSISSGAGFTTVTFDSELFDQGGLHSTSVNTGRITVVVPGLYLLYAQVAWDANATGIRTCTIEKNGSGVSEVTHVIAGSASAQNEAVTKLVVAVAGDYYEFRVGQTSGGNLNINGGVEDTFFMAVKLW